MKTFLGLRTYRMMINWIATINHRQRPYEQSQCELIPITSDHSNSFMLVQTQDLLLQAKFPERKTLQKTTNQLNSNITVNDVFFSL